MPRILYFATEDWFFVSHFLPMARAARRAGLDGCVAARISDRSERLTAEGLRVVPFGGDRGSLGVIGVLRDLLHACRIIRAERPDIVHCIGLRQVLIAGTAARLVGARKLLLATIGLGHLWTDDSSQTRFLRGIVRNVIRFLLHGRNTHYLFENTDDPRDFGFDIGAPEVTIVGGAGVDPKEFPMLPEPPAPPVRIAVVARMIESKGIATAVGAVRRAREFGADVELDLYGEPDRSNPLSIPEDLLRKWSLEPGIRWRGHTPDVAAVWREHHIALYLSRYREGLPRSLIEAAASARPIVTADTTGCREFVHDGREGFVVAPGDVDGAAHAIKLLADDPALRARMGVAANARFHHGFTEQAVMSVIERLYRSMLGTP
jgi:glycosyltransferase involved in cell wall biosynthesis